MTNIKSITLVFENCDSVEVPIAAIDYCTASSIVNGCSFNHEGSVRKYKTIGEIYIRFNSNIDVIRCDLTDKAKDRIMQYKDITQISLNYDSFHNEHFLVKWKGDCDENNLQKVYEEYGCFCVEIGEE